MCGSTPSIVPDVAEDKASTGKAYVHVAVGLVVNASGQVLVTRRPAHVHQGGLWEFPGGKLEPGEEVQAGLTRELQEELGIQVIAARPFLRVPHDYPDKSVLLDVWRVDVYRGRPRGLEGQPLAWYSPEALASLRLPAADQPIIQALQREKRSIISGSVPSTV